MDKIKFIKAFAARSDAWNRQTIIPALVSCLTSEEASHALQSMSLEDPMVRRAFLKKVIRDIRHEGCQPCHAILVESLISSFQSLPIEKRQTCGYVLGSLHDALPPDMQQTITRFLITSPYVAMRDRGHKILRRNWTSEYAPAISRSWATHRDYYCALLILEHFPDSFLQDNLRSLERVLRGKEGLPTLYIRVAASKPDVLRRLEREDGVTFAYVTFKLGRSLTPQQASSIFGEYKFDKRIGLFIWCLGRMNLWSSLRTIAVDAERLNKEESEYVRRKYGLE